MSSVNFLKDLPSELSWHIISYLEINELSMLGSVSRTWKEYSDDELRWKELCQELWSKSYGYKDLGQDYCINKLTNQLDELVNKVNDNDDADMLTTKIKSILSPQNRYAEIIRVVYPIENYLEYYRLHKIPLTTEEEEKYGKEENTSKETEEEKNEKKEDSVNFRFKALLRSQYLDSSDEEDEHLIKLYEKEENENQKKKAVSQGEMQMDISSSSSCIWKKAYQYTLMDLSRTVISIQELTTHPWKLNFRYWNTFHPRLFGLNHTFVSPFSASLPWRCVYDLDGELAIQVHHYPWLIFGRDIHGHWTMRNQHVVLETVGPHEDDGLKDYDSCVAKYMDQTLSVTSFYDGEGEEEEEEEMNEGESESEEEEEINEGESEEQEQMNEEQEINL